LTVYLGKILNKGWSF